MYQEVPYIFQIQRKQIAEMTNANELNRAGYIERLEKIRRLSSPSLEGIGDAGLYSDLLRQNFTRIGRLSTENRAFLDAELFPVLFSQKPLSPAQTEYLITTIQ